jgi:hypothetical protein
MNRLIIAAMALLITLPCYAQPKAPFDCSASAPHRDFDFWVGRWSVSDRSGKVLGKNRIRSIQNGCALEEQWKSERGGTGQSINYYHPGREEWRQLWVDGGASIIDIRGGLIEEVMVLEGTIHYLGQDVEKGFRGSWTPLEDGRVRQFFEEKDPGGEWKVWFEGFYTREQ